MSPPKAEGYIRQLMQNYWSKKSFSLDENKRVDSFNPQSILDAYWFPKREGSSATEVTTLPGGQNLGELDDLNYFVKKLYNKKLLDKIETRNIIFKLNRNNTKNLEEAVKKALSFESLWLRTKSSYYMSIGNSYLNRAGILDDRI